MKLLFVAYQSQLPKETQVRQQRCLRKLCTAARAGGRSTCIPELPNKTDAATWFPYRGHLDSLYKLQRACTRAGTWPAARKPERFERTMLLHVDMIAGLMHTASAFDYLNACRCLWVMPDHACTGVLNRAWVWLRDTPTPRPACSPNSSRARTSWPHWLPGFVTMCICKTGMNDIQLAST